MKWKIEITQIVDAPDTYTVEQVRQTVMQQFGTEVVRVEQIVEGEEDTTPSTNDETDTITV